VKVVDWLKGTSQRSRLAALIVSVVIVLDQITKYWAVGALSTAFRPIDGSELGFFDKLDRFLWLKRPARLPEGVTVIQDFWDFKYVENNGAAWGLLANAPSWFRAPFFSIVSIAAMAFIIVYFRRTLPEQKLLRFSLALVFGGAVGNFLDRVRLGYVIDFIDWHYYATSWPTFNVADAAISVGVVLMLLDIQLAKRREKAGTPAKAT
jgi:signal peptidase II